MVYGPNEKGISQSISKFISPMEKTRLYERLSFEVVMIMVKDKKDAVKKIQCQSKLVLCIMGSGQE